MQTHEVYNLLKESIKSKDPEDVETALNTAFKFGLKKEYTAVLIKILQLEWHTRHEDIIFSLQELKPPAAVDALYETSLREYKYRNYDEFYTLARKCTWALEDIGTQQAKEKLQILSENSNITIANYARKRLDNWEREAKRKGAKQNFPPDSA